VLALGGCGGNGPDAEGSDGQGGQGETEREAVPVEVTTIERGRIEAVLRFSTNLEAEREVDVLSEASRQVTELLVEEGDRVLRGQPLLRLDDEVQRSNVAKVDSQLRRARQELSRQKELFAQSLVAEQTFNDASYEVEQLELQLADARRELGYTEVRAPISGTVTSRLVNLGDFVTVNQTLFHMVDFDSIVARVYVPEKELARLSPGQPARITADAVGSRHFSGSVDRISPVVDPGTGTVKVTVAIPLQQGLRPGMYVVVELVTAVHADAVLVPKRALVYDNDQIFIFRLAEDRKVERLEVVPELESSEWIEPGFPDADQAARAPIAPGDQVVVAGQTGLKDGGRVRLPGDPETTPEPDAPGEPDEAGSSADDQGPEATGSEESGS
jgi:membrane fusion protein (multidrug efflux system)